METNNLRAILDAAETAAGQVYAKIAGTYQAIDTWTEEHPEVLAAADTAATLLKAAGIDLSPEIKLRKLVWARLGLLLARDPTVQGPTLVASQNAAAATGGAS